MSRKRAIKLQKALVLRINVDFHLLDEVSEAMQFLTQVFGDEVEQLEDQLPIVELDQIIHARTSGRLPSMTDRWTLVAAWIGPSAVTKLSVSYGL